MTIDPPDRSAAYDDVVRPFRAVDLTWFVLLAWAGLMCVVLAVFNSPGTYIAPGLEGFLLTAVAVVSLLVTWAASLLAWMLGRAMRRVRPIVAHLLVFGAVGFFAGAAVGAIGSASARTSDDDVALAAGLVCAACAVLGRSGAFIARWITNRLRHRGASTAAP